jgi:hypothetical protein
MFRPTDRQRSLFGAADSLTPRQRKRLQGSWAHLFHLEVFPLLLSAEGEFADLYVDGSGRPNWSIARMLGILLLQEMHDASDQSALDALTFDTRWQHALDIKPDLAQLSRRSLVDFRARLQRADPELERIRGLFDRILLAARNDLGISTEQQRIDSTHIVSNIRIRGRADLFTKTLRHFLTGLRRGHPDLFASLDEELREWAERSYEGWFARSDANARRQAFDQVVRWCDEVLLRFANDKAISQDERFVLLKRLFEEQCRIDEVDTPDGTGEKPAALPAPEDERPPDDDDEPPAAKVRTANQKKRRRKAAKRNTKSRTIPVDDGRAITLKGPSEVGGASLQSPFDPDAGYGHKGSGYSVHIAETCNNPGTELLTDFSVCPANLNDQGQAAQSVERLQRNCIRPDKFFADSGYVTTKALEQAENDEYELYGPVLTTKLPDGWIGRNAFTIDPSTRQVLLCPEGHPPLRHGLRFSDNEPHPTLHAWFDGQECRPCPLLGRCAVRKPNNGKAGNFHLELIPRLVARDKRLAEQADSGWWEEYSIRGGIEATHSELKRAHGLGRLRVRGRKAVGLAVALKLTACNIKRWARAAAAAAVWKAPRRLLRTLERVLVLFAIAAAESALMPGRRLEAA